VSRHRLLGGKESFIQSNSGYFSQPPDAVGNDQERQGNDMHILVISRSTGRSRRRVASLMDSYAVRTGESSWSTPITREALAELRAALRRVASRTACVGCYVNVGRSRLRLAWTVGRGGEFEPTGATPVAWMRRKHKPVVPVWVRRLALLAAAGGVSHDIGKASCGFQRKLNSAEPVSDAVRHEWLSMQVRRRLRAMDWRAAWDLGGREGTAMTTVPEFMRHGITSALDAVDFLIVSHHGLLGPKRSDQNRSRAALPDDSLHIREVKEALSRDTLLPQAKLDARTLAEMNAAERRLTAMSETVFPAGWWASAVFARAALVFADHTVSGVERKDRKAALYANTVRPSGGKGRSVLNQSLDWHLTEVSRRAADVLPRMMRPDLQGLSLDTVEHILKPNPEPGGRFQWQDAATDALVQLRERQPDAPVLVLNLAGTGSGKTRMNAKAACALARGPVRFSVALSLRTLTLQTGDALKHQLHVAADELAVVIGDAVVTQLHESRQRSSASKLDDDENPLVDDHDTTPGDFDLPPWLDAWVTQHPSQARLLGAPLLVSTIDYLIAAGEPHRQQHHVSALLRLLSSDLVLDEIDSYDPKAMVAVLRLILMAGLCGRNVIASSATLAEPVAQAVCRVYVAGVQGRADMKGRAGAAPVQVVFLSDAQAPQCFDTADYTRSFEAAYRGYVEQGLLSLDEPDRPRVRWATVVEATHPTWWGKDQYARVSADERGEGWMRYVVKAAKRLHRAHAWAFPGSTSKVSFGLIRVANIRPAISLARFIAAAGDGTDSTIRVQVACYHSQELLIQRHLKEARLDHLLSRSAGDEHLHRDPDLIERVRRADGRDVMFIVVATPVEEIGRDHDFDWAVIEPSSSQSIVQTAGRVNRHRLAPVTKPNIAVLDLNYLAAVRADRMDGAEPVFVRPGLEGDFPRALGEKAYPKHRLSALLANEFTVDARLRFRTEQYELSRLDDASLTAALTMPLEMITSTAIRPDPKLMAQVFYDAYPLREPSFKVELTVDPELDPDRQLKRWEKTAAGWRPLVTEYGEGHGTQARHPLDWLAWNLDELIEAAQALDLSADQCLCVEVNMPRRGDDAESADALKQLRWDRSFGFWMAPKLLHSAAGASA
jgi:CRISPR-associated endonuclease/helicase Cas3